MGGGDRPADARLPLLPGQAQPLRSERRALRRRCECGGDRRSCYCSRRCGIQSSGEACRGAQYSLMGRRAAEEQHQRPDKDDKHGGGRDPGRSRGERRPESTSRPCVLDRRCPMSAVCSRRRGSHLRGRRPCRRATVRPHLARTEEIPPEPPDKAGVRAGRVVESVEPAHDLGEGRLGGVLARCPLRDGIPVAVQPVLRRSVIPNHRVPPAGAVRRSAGPATGSPRETGAS